jgi:thiol-disulfide isomerase/thioredoxin
VTRVRTILATCGAALLVLAAVFLLRDALAEGRPRRAVVAPAGGAAEPDERLGDIPADRWLQAPQGGLSGAGLRGDVVLVEFWTYLCYNCKNVEGWMKETHAELAPRGLRVIGVHTPEFAVERKVDNVTSYPRKNRIVWPVAIDNGFRVWRRYNATHAWPAFLVYDRTGRLVYRRAGERAVHGAREAIDRALGEPAPASNDVPRDRATGVVVKARTLRTDDGGVVVEVSFEPWPGFRLVMSPPGEVRLDAPGSSDEAVAAAVLGHAFEGRDARDVRYFEGRTAVRIPVKIDPAFGDSLTFSGTAVYGICDERTRACARQETVFCTTAHLVGDRGS